MTALIGAAFIIHRQQEPAYLAGQSYTLQQSEPAGAAHADLLTPTAGDPAHVIIRSRVLQP